jgi:hypothetical protein
MSELIEAKDGQVYTGYSLTGSPFCIPVSNLNICYEADVEIGGVTLKISMKIPLTVSRKFVITGNGSFEWTFGPVIIQTTISNFNRNGRDYSFDGNCRINLMGFSRTGSHHFESTRLLKAAAEPTDAEFTNMLILQLLLEKENEKCNCH